MLGHCNKLLSMTLAACLAGCQTYDFEPVAPLSILQATDPAIGFGQKYKPNIVLLLDTSKSMDLPIDATKPSCQVNGVVCGQKADKSDLCNEAVCPTRIGQVRSAMQTFLTQGNDGTLARFGFTNFPQPPTLYSTTEQLCAPASKIRVEVPVAVADTDTAGLQQAANNVNASVQLFKSNGGTGPDGTLNTPLGGTPTGTTFQWLGRYPTFNNPDGLSRDNYVILLTDGLPNCNPSNPNPYTTSPQACGCTLASGDCSGVPELGCLDVSQTSAVLSDLSGRANNPVKTFVVGFGAETVSGPAVSALNKLAIGGSLPRTCKLDADCGAGSTCLLGTPAGDICSQAFYHADNAAQLANILIQLTKRVQNACQFQLSIAPSKPQFLSVYADGIHLDPGVDTYNYDGQVAVTFQGAECESISSRGPTNPVKIQFLVARSL